MITPEGPIIDLYQATVRTDGTWDVTCRFQTEVGTFSATQEMLPEMGCDGDWPVSLGEQNDVDTHVPGAFHRFACKAMQGGYPLCWYSSHSAGYTWQMTEAHCRTQPGT